MDLAGFLSELFRINILFNFGNLDLAPQKILLMPK